MFREGHSPSFPPFVWGGVGRGEPRKAPQGLFSRYLSQSTQWESVVDGEAHDLKKSHKSHVPGALSLPLRARSYPFIGGGHS